MQAFVFTGTFEELMVRLEAAGLRGGWEEHPAELYRLVTADGARLDWSATDGRFALDAPPEGLADIESRLKEALANL